MLCLVQGVFYVDMLLSSTLQDMNQTGKLNSRFNDGTPTTAHDVIL